MQPGDSCMIIIRNGVVSPENQKGFWKIWKDQKDLQFFMAPAINSTDDNELDKISNPGQVEEIERGDTKYLFVTNPTLKTKSFKLNYAGSPNLKNFIKNVSYLCTLALSGIILIYF